MKKMLQGNNIGFSIMGLATGGYFSISTFSLVWGLCAYFWKANNSFTYVHITKINDNNPILFLLPILILIGSIEGGMILGSKISAKTNKKAMAICGAALGGIIGTALASLLFTIIECYRQVAL